VAAAAYGTTVAITAGRNLTLAAADKQGNITQRRANDFTAADKEQIREDNAARNGGKNVCENCGVETTPGKKSQKGVRPPANERQHDHKIPVSKGGTRDPSNGQILCRECNLEKSDN
jgi:membrane protease subunit (stomatin/prohibitin family)